MEFPSADNHILRIKMEELLQELREIQAQQSELDQTIDVRISTNVLIVFDL